ncbi:MAG: DUF1552 domain-containing protein [Lentisphaeraceae bacterium]|nr:DUF1552 domain-containing protein [Lentisphaeraceae bacterium]
MANFITKKSIDRRLFLKGSGTAMALPFLSAMLPALSSSGAAQKMASPKRFLACNAPLGFHTPYLYPEKAGKDYKLTPYLEQIKDHRSDFTVFSGVSHLNQSGNNGHSSESTWLTAARRPGLAGFKNTISLDQMIARKFGHETRFPYLVITARGASLSWTANGVPIPGEGSASRLFKKLFVNGSKREVEAQVKRLAKGKSILDTIMNPTKKLERELGHKDKEKLEEYTTSIRELEVRLTQNQDWVTKPKPKVNYKPAKEPEKHDIIAKQNQLYDIIALAFETDSTRAVTMSLGGMNAVPDNIPGVATDWHNLSHHGKDPEKIKELKLVEEAEFKALNGFLNKVKAAKEGSKSILDSTTVIYGSNLGNASAHSWMNLPLVVIGGDFNHGSHIAYDQKNNEVFANLFVQVANKMGINIDKFGSSTGTSLKGFS